MIEQKESTTTSHDHRYLKPKTKNPFKAPGERPAELFASIKKSSEYHHQGLDLHGNPLIYRVESIRHGVLCFRLNSNSYSTHDLAFYVKDTKGNLILLAGGVSR